MESYNISFIYFSAIIPFTKLLSIINYTTKYTNKRQNIEMVQYCFESLIHIN